MALDLSIFEALLREKFTPVVLDISNDDDTGCGAKLRVKIVSDAFLGMNRLKRAKAVNAVFKEYLDDGRVHALSVEAKDVKQYDETKA